LPPGRMTKWHRPCPWLPRLRRVFSRSFRLAFFRSCPGTCRSSAG
jgi:hypothetical protein